MSRSSADSSDVLIPGHNIKVIGSETRPVPAQVVDLHTVRNGSDPHSVGKPVDENLSLGFVTPQQSVTGIDAGGGSLPATSIGNGSVMDQSIFVAKSRPKCLRHGVNSVALVECTQPTGSNLAGTPIDYTRAVSRLSWFYRSGKGVVAPLRHPFVRRTQTPCVMASSTPRYIADSHTRHGRNTTRKGR